MCVAGVLRTYKAYSTTLDGLCSLDNEVSLLVVVELYLSNEVWEANGSGRRMHGKLFVNAAALVPHSKYRNLLDTMYSIVSYCEDISAEWCGSYLHESHIETYWQLEWGENE